MCTLIVSIDPAARFPLVVAANRDELLDRPSSDYRVWGPGPVPFVAPRDEVAGGSWIGLNARGLFVAITNRFPGPRDPARRSRGALVIETLGNQDVRSAHRALAGLDPATLNAFHLLYADAHGQAGVTWSDGATLRQERLDPGLHVVTERSYGTAEVSRVGVVRRLWPSTTGPDGPDPAALTRLLSHHDPEDPFAALCIHSEALRYGTRSSTLLLLAPTLARSRLFSSEGPPCQTPLVERSALLLELSESPGSR